MKQRITYVVKDPDAFSPKQLKVIKQNGNSPAKFILDNVNAAKEHRITMGLDELPDEFRKLFQQWQELRIRLTSAKHYTSTPPFTSRSSPGLHVFFTPLDKQPDADLCHLIHRIYSSHLKCSSTKDTAVKMPVLSEGSSMPPSSSMHYYSDVPVSVHNPWLPDLRVVLRKISDRFTSDEKLLDKFVDEVSSADSVDVDYDAMSQAVVFTVHWSSSPGNPGNDWTEAISVPDNESTVEIGVLSHEPNSDPEDIQFGGFLTVLGRDDAPKPTRFQTPTRHYPLLVSAPYSPTQTPKRHPLEYTASINEEEGLHPTLSLAFPAQHLAPPDPTCKLHTYLTLPSSFFIDRYQFNDALFLQSKNLKALHSLAGATDLEAPDWAIPQWGSAALFELAHPTAPTQGSTTEWNVSIPLHLRYQPANDHYNVNLDFPWPVVFWACHADAGVQMAGNPFDRVHLGYEALFGSDTRFMHVEPAFPKGTQGRLVEKVSVPTLEWERTAWVEVGTVGTVIAAFLGLCWVLFGKRGRSENEGKKTQ